MLVVVFPHQYDSICWFSTLAAQIWLLRQHFLRFLNLPALYDYFVLFYLFFGKMCLLVTAVDGMLHSYEEEGGNQQDLVWFGVRWFTSRNRSGFKKKGSSERVSGGSIW